MLGLSAPLLLADNGPVHTGLAASADSAATVYLNPAGLTRIEEQEMGDAHDPDHRSPVLLPGR